MIAIIGTAGRKEDGPKLNRAFFEWMFQGVKFIVDRVDDPNLISGGAAWADHIAVRLFLSDPDKYRLTLALPTEFHPVTCRFSKTRDGDVADYYHTLFEKNSGVQSKFEISQAMSHKNCRTIVGKGFFARNVEVAKNADVVIALTFGNGSKIKDGGTLFTTKKFVELGGKGIYHINLNDKTLYVEDCV